MLKSRERLWLEGAVENNSHKKAVRPEERELVIIFEIRMVFQFQFLMGGVNEERVCVCVWVYVHCSL